MLNALALLTGFIITIVTLMPPTSLPKQPETEGIKIASQPKVYYPNLAEEDEKPTVLAQTNETQDEINNQEEKELTPTLSEPEAVPSRRPTPTLSPPPTSTPTPTPREETNVLSQEPTNFIMNQINSYRTANGLPAFETHSEVCSFAQVRLNEIQSGFNHEGFNERLQNGTLPYSSFSQVAENIADAPSYTQVFDMWKNSSGHNQKLLSSMQYACVAGSGRLYVFESWTP